MEMFLVMTGAGTGASIFQIHSSTAVTLEGQELDYETAGNHILISVQMDDGSLTYSEQFTISVTDVNVDTNGCYRNIDNS